MADQLTALQNPVNDDDLVYVITNGLGLEYRPFIRSLKNRIDTVNFDDLYGLLLSEEANLQAESKCQEPLLPTPQFVFFNSRI